MGKNRNWSYEEKVNIVLKSIEGQSYNSLQKEFNIKSRGMIANWKKAYLNSTLSKEDRRGKPRKEFDDIEMIKKCYAQLMKIRSK